MNEKSYEIFARYLVPAAFAAIAGLLLSAAAPSDAIAAFDSDELRCRNTIAKSGTKMAKTAVKELGACHKKRDIGSLPPGTDCNSTLEADLKEKITKAESKLVLGASSRCAGLDPATLGYTGCPVPCDGLVPSISTFEHVGECVACIVRTSVEDGVTNGHGNPGVPIEGDDLKCHANIGKNLAKHMATVIGERVRCQRSAEKAGETETTGCEDTDPRGKIASVRGKVDTKVSALCENANLSGLDLCSDSNVAGLVACIFGDSEARGEKIFESFYKLAPTTGGGGPTTTIFTSTTSTTTTTMGGGSGQDPQCPNKNVLSLLPATSDVVCSTNGDCAFGTCDPGLGFCVTETELDTGWTGIAHNADINDAVPTIVDLECSGPAPVCGQCTIQGFNAETGFCRCDGDMRTICDEPFQADADDCGGSTCNCFFGPPLPLSSGNTPACVVNRFAVDMTGTLNLDTGEGASSTELASVVFLGENLIQPCPYCSGDVTPNDGVRDGTCVSGENAGQTCDANANNLTFPAPGGGDHSLDCMPDPGKNVSGTGLKIEIDQSTGSASLGSAVECGFPPFVFDECHCGRCSNEVTTGCSSNDDCTGGGVCESAGSGQPFINQCAIDNVCNDIGGGEAECNQGPNDKFCDAIVRKSGEGFITCISNLDCDASIIGVDAGDCTLTAGRPCFTDTITAQGAPDPIYPLNVALFCVGQTSNPAINSVAGLPGPTRIRNAGESRAYCASDPGVEYVPGVGGCP